MFDIMEDYLCMCPQLADMDIRLDYGSAGEGWTLHDGGSEVLCLYWDGSRLKKQSFSLQFRAYAATDSERKENEKLLSRVALWLQRSSDLGILPELGEERRAIKIDCETKGMVSMEEGISAVYHLPLSLCYEERSAQFASETRAEAVSASR